MTTTRIELKHAHVDAASFNLKKQEVRITITAWLSQEVLDQRLDLQMLTTTEQPIVAVIETVQPELPFQ